MVVNVRCEGKRDMSVLLPSTGSYVSFAVFCLFTQVATLIPVPFALQNPRAPSSRSDFRVMMRVRKKEDGRTLPGHVIAR